MDYNWLRYVSLTASKLLGCVNVVLIINLRCDKTLLLPPFKQWLQVVFNIATKQLCCLYFGLRHKRSRYIA
jgi:hypothetical protein